MNESAPEAKVTGRAASQWAAGTTGSIVLLTAVLVTVVATPVEAQSTDEINATLQFNFSNPGARSLGMGGAFAARADDATAVYANPAGLLQLTKPEVAFDLRGWEYSNLFLQGGSLTGPQGLMTDTTDARTAGLSFVSAYYPSRSGRWGVGLYRHESARFESSVRSDGTPLTGGAFVRPLDGSYRLEIANLGLSIARRLGRRFSLGASLFHATLDLNSRTERLNKLRSEVQSPDPTNPSLDFVSAFGNDAKDLANYQVQRGDDSDLSLTLGGLLHSDRSRGGAPLVSVGAVYRKGPKLAFRGSPFERTVRNRPGGGFFHLLVPRLDPATRRPLCPATGCPGSFKVPDVLAIGISLRPSARWVFALDLDRVEYSDLTDVTIDIVAADSGLRGSTGAPLDYAIADGTEIRLGAEYGRIGRRLPDLFFRAGAWLDPDHRIRYSGPSAELDALWTPGDDELHLSAGIGLRAPRFQIDLAVDSSDRVDTISLSAVYYFGRSARVLGKRRRAEPCQDSTPVRGHAEAEARELLRAAERSDLPDHERRYLMARRAADRHNWREAAALFSLAEEARRRVGAERPELVRVYGTLAESYLPNTYLGMSLYAIEDYAGALRAWEIGDPGLAAPRNQGKRRYLDRLRRELPALLACRARRLDDELRQERQRLISLAAAPLDTTPSRVDPAGQALICSEVRLEDLEAPPTTEPTETRCEDLSGSRIELHLCATENHLGDYRRRAAEGELAQLAESIESGGMAIDRARRSVAGLALLGESTAAEARLVEEERSAREERLRSFQPPPGESCENAILRLTQLAKSGPIAPSEKIYPYRELALAAARCRRWEQAALFLELARKVTREQRDAVTLGSEEIAWRLASELRDVADQAAERCEPHLALELTHLAADRSIAAFVESSLGGSPDTWATAATEACGTGSPDAAATTANRRLALEVTDQRQLEEALVQFLEARARIEAGDCGAELSELLRRAGAILRDPAWTARLDGHFSGGLGKIGNQAELEVTLNRLLGAAACRASGRDHALVIGASSYTPPWEELDGPQDDVNEISRALRDQGFEVTPLLDPTAEQLLTQAVHFAAKHANPDNRLLVYFAGHGQTHLPQVSRDPNSATAFLVPVDAGSEAQSHPLPLTTFRSLFKTSSALQKMFIFDSCFAGNLVHRMETRFDWSSRDSAELESRPVESILTAGGDEQAVPDFSVFRRSLVRGLNGAADYDTDQRVMGHELARFLKETVPALTAPESTCPQFGIPRDFIYPESGPGDLAFAAINGEAERDPQELATEIDMWRKVWNRNSLERYQTYLDWYGDQGVFTELARLRVAQLTEGVAAESERWLRVLRALLSLREPADTVTRASK